MEKLSNGLKSLFDSEACVLISWQMHCRRHGRRCMEDSLLKIQAFSAGDAGAQVFAFCMRFFAFCMRSSYWWECNHELVWPWQSWQIVLLDHAGNIHSTIGLPQRLVVGSCFVECPDESDPKSFFTLLRTDGGNCRALTYYTMSLRLKKHVGDLTGEARSLVKPSVPFEFLVDCWEK